MMKRYNYWIGILVSTILIIFFFRKIDWIDTWNLVKNVRIEFILVIIILQFISIWVRAKRWGYLLLHIKKIGLRRLFTSLTIGFMANNLLPTRLGELVRAYLLGSREQISKIASLATIVVERLFDGFIILILFFFSILFTYFPEKTSQQIASKGTIQILGFIVFSFYIAVIILLLFYRYSNKGMSIGCHKFLSLLPKNSEAYVLNKLNSFVQGFEVLKRNRDLLIVFFYSCVIWFLSPLSIYLLYLAFNIKLSFVSAFFLSAVIVLGVSIPSAPGYLGTFHWACAVGLMILGVETTLAKGFAMLLWVINFVPVTAAGLFFLWREGLTLKGLQKTEIESH